MALNELYGQAGFADTTSSDDHELVFSEKLVMAEDMSVGDPMFAATGYWVVQTFEAIMTAMSRRAERWSEGK
jgi:hypothetical protein